MTSSIIVVGAGAIGMSTALLLKQEGYEVSLIDAAKAPDETAYRSGRALALNRLSQHLLSRIGVWDNLTSVPYHAMEIWTPKASMPLTFSDSDWLGHIVESGDLNARLYEACQMQGIVQHYETPVVTCHFSKEAAFLNNHYQAPLIVAADGAHSTMRHLLSINVNTHHYAQQALVATIQTSVPHDNRAYQIFLPEGPLAFLPLSDPYQCSIVWTQTAEQASKRKQMPVEAFEADLLLAFEQRLGTVKLCSQRQTFPLVAREVSRYWAERVVFLGDAAHTVHPLAGQGMNLGFADAKALVEMLSNAKTLALDPATPAVLQRYQNVRQGNNRQMQGLMTLLARVFSGEAYFASCGLSAINHFPFLKKYFQEFAQGER